MWSMNAAAYKTHELSVNTDFSLCSALHIVHNMEDVPFTVVQSHKHSVLQPIYPPYCYLHSSLPILSDGHNHRNITREDTRTQGEGEATSTALGTAIQIPCPPLRLSQKRSHKRNPIARATTCSMTSP